MAENEGYDVGALVYNKSTGAWGTVNSDGSVTPKPSVQGEPLNPMTPKPGLGQQALTMAGQSILPTLGTMGGAALGTAAAPFTGGVLNPVTGGMIGGATGEWGNQKLGITPPSKTTIALSGAIPAVPAAARTVMMNIPGAAAGMQHLAVKLARNMPAKYLAEPGAISALYQEGERLGAAIPRQAVQDVADMVAAQAIDPLVKSARLAAIQRGVNIVREVAAMPPTGMGPESDVTLKQLLPNLQRLGQIYGETLSATEKIGKGKTAVGALSDLYNGMLDTLDQAATRGGAGVEVIDRAKEMFKRNLAGEEMKALNFRAFSTTGGHEQIAGDTLLRAMSEGSPMLKRMERWLPKEELADITQTYQTLAKLPRITSGARQGSGDVGFIQRSVMGGVAGGIAGPALGMDSSTGGLVGIAAAEATTRLMMSPVGRSIVRQLADVKVGGKSMTFDQVISAALQFTRQNPGAAGQMAGAGFRTAVTPLSRMLSSPDQNTPQ